MIQLFKIRTFSDYFSDTIAFFKASGKHFFRNYFIVNGGFLMVLVVMIYFVANFYIEAIGANFTSNFNDGSNSFDTFFQQNLVLFITFIIVFVLLIIILSMLNVAFPIVYLDLYQQNEGGDFSTKQLITSLKNNTGSMLIFTAGTIFVYLPLFVVVLGICIALCFIIIGIPLLLVVFPALYSWISIAFYDYLTNKSSFFESFSVGFNTVKNDFWAISGSTFLMMMVVQIMQTVVTIIPYLIGIAFYFFSKDELTSNAEKSLDFLSILILIVFVLSMISGYLANNLLVIAQGMMYYSGREKIENYSAEDLINKIGSDFE